jgi:putative transposase
VSLNTRFTGRMTTLAVSREPNNIPSARKAESDAGGVNAEECFYENEMAFAREVSNRVNPRLAEFDYSQPGGYFITICTEERKNLFGAIIDGDIILNPVGRIVEQCWHAIPNHFNFIELDAFVIMPNHVHGIILINENPSNFSFVGTTHASSLPSYGIGKGCKPGSLSAIIDSYKSACSRMIHRSQLVLNQKIWQRNYYDHIIRNEQDWEALHDYILANPENWLHDPEFG